MPIRAQHPNRRGAMIILMVILMAVIVGMVGFAVEVGRVGILRSEVQNAVDAGALAASLQLSQDPDGLEAAKVAARAFVQQNRAGSSVEIPAEAIGVEIGEWNPLNKSFTTATQFPNSVRVFARQDNEPFYFARFFGPSTFGAQAPAVASGSARLLDINLVLDLTDSMSDEGRIEALQNSAPAFVNLIEAFGGDDQISVMGYGVKPKNFESSTMGPGSPYREKKSSSSSWVAVLEADMTDDFSSLTSSVLTTSNLVADKYGGGTPIGAAVRDGAHYVVNNGEARDEAKKVVVFLSDGKANKPSSNAKGYAYSKADYAAGLGVTVYTISLGNDADIEMMEEIARRTGGIHFDATGAGEALLTERLTRVFKRLVTTFKRPQLVR